MKNKKSVIIIAVTAVIIVAAVVCGVIFSKHSKEKDVVAVNKSAVSESSKTSKTSETSKSEVETEREKDTVNVSEKDLYKLIGVDGKDLPNYVSSTGNPCADGGNLLKIGADGYYASTHREDDDGTGEIKGTIKTIYINGYDHYIINGLNTGRDYKYYKDRVKDISSLEYDYSLFSYCCSFKETVNSKPVIVSVFFNSPEGKSTGAVISTENLKGKYIGNCKAENNLFLLNQGGLPLSEMKNNYSELFDNNVAHIGIYSMQGKNVNLCFVEGSDNDEYEDIENYLSDDISSFGMYLSDASYMKNTEILPGIKYGDSYDSVISKGYTFFGDAEYSEHYGKNLCSFTFRVGAVNYEAYAFIDDNGKIMEETDFIIKCLCS